MTYDRTDRLDVHDAATLEHYYQILYNQIHLKRGNPCAFWEPDQWEAPGTNPAQLTTRAEHPILAFRAGTGPEYAHFPGVLGRAYDGNGLRVTIWWVAATAITGSVVWAAEWERHDSAHDLDSSSWSTAKEVTTAAPTSGAGRWTSSVIDFTDSEIDGLLVGESFRLRISRDPLDPNDDMIGDAQITHVGLYEIPA